MLDIIRLVRYYNEAVTERYRSGHNEAVLKTVCPQGHVGSNPTLSAHHIKMMVVENWIRTSSFSRNTQVVEGAPLERE